MSSPTSRSTQAMVPQSIYSSATLLGLPADIRARIFRSAGLVRSCPIGFSRERERIKSLSSRRRNKNIGKDLGYCVRPKIGRAFGKYPFECMHDPLPIALLQVSWQVYNESSAILYKENKFYITCPPRNGDANSDPVHASSSQTTFLPENLSPRVYAHLSELHIFVYRTKTHWRNWKNLIRLLGSKLCPRTTHLSIHCTGEWGSSTSAAAIKAIKAMAPGWECLNLRGFSAFFPDSGYFPEGWQVNDISDLLSDSATRELNSVFPFTEDLKIPSLPQNLSYDAEQNIIHHNELVQTRDISDLLSNSAMRTLASVPHITPDLKSPFLFQNLPQELRRNVLLHTGLVQNPEHWARHAVLQHTKPIRPGDRVCCKTCKPAFTHCTCNWTTTAYSSSCSCVEVPMALFVVSRQMRAEALEVYYSEQPIALECKLHDTWTKLFSIDSVGVKHLKSLNLVFQPKWKKPVKYKKLQTVENHVRRFFLELSKLCNVAVLRVDFCLLVYDEDWATTKYPRRETDPWHKRALEDLCNSVRAISSDEDAKAMMPQRVVVSENLLKEVFDHLDMYGDDEPIIYPDEGDVPKDEDDLNSVPWARVHLDISRLE